MSISNVLTFSLSKMMRFRRTLSASIPSLRSCRRFAKSSSSSMPTPLTREMFISPNNVKVATSRPTMFDFTEDGECISQVPVPASVRESGIIPDGYSVGWSFDRQRCSILCSISIPDLIFDPSIVVAAFRKRGINMVE